MIQSPVMTLKREKHIRHETVSNHNAPEIEKFTCDEKRRVLPMVISSRKSSTIEESEGNQKNKKEIYFCNRFTYKSE